ncbi:hypothetical protein RhiirC2_791589 [Rhizophagus irregularis]|uniref:Uncharacterized protein n=1 Tax=Rhizophagus irregularis TaxID=588596 RepID=A0A2N1MJ08_9GLOM|nr:hypothetical protein RhiirC2_791589 [Rhizophagus irregularis]
MQQDNRRTSGCMKSANVDFQFLDTQVLGGKELMVELQALKLWCRLAIPLLWEDPFSIPTKNYNFIEIYLHNLNDDFRAKKWFKSKNRRVTDFENLSDISVSLFSIFIENEINLHTLEIEILGSIYHCTCIDNILGLILKNPNFIHNIRNLNLYFGNSYVGSSKYTLMKNRISQIINLHQNLKKIMLGYDSIPLYQSLLSEDFNCSNTLNTIIFHYVSLNCISNLQKVFERLNVLESVHIHYCRGLNTSFTQQIINLTKPFNDFEVFLKNIQDTFIKKLLFENFQSQVDILPFIKEYIMKKKRIKYLAIKESSLVKDLISLEGEVDEFKFKS